MRSFLAKIATTLAAVAFAAVVSAGVFAASEFEGKWQVKDTKGKPFEITLSQDGTAKGSRTEEALKGTWKAVGDAVLITWDLDGPRRSREKGNTFEKTALQNGKPVGQPTEAMKVQ